MTLIPAYGRDYKSKKDAIKSFFDGDDWIINDVSSAWNGRYVSIKDKENLPDTINLRYSKLTRVAVLKKEWKNN